MRIFTCIFLILSIVGLQAKTIYVKVDGNGDGTSWADAMGNLVAALEAATYGDQVWVARGVYHPTHQDDRNATFEVFDGVKMYGGFMGNETALEQRDWVKNKTTLSGEIGTPAIEDNVFSVLYTHNVSEATVIDGFTITKGAANGTGDKGSMERCGGGWFNEGRGGNSSPTIANCIFIHNYAQDGAGIYNYANEGVCSPRINNCQFIENKAGLDGGAIYNDSKMGICNPVIKDCKIINNQATYGGGILNNALNGEASPSIIGCSFEDNTGYIRAGSIFSYEKEGGRCSPSITSSFFSDNKATVGKEINEEQVVSKGVLKKM